MPVHDERLLTPASASAADEDGESPWPDLVLIDGGQGQLSAARETLAALGVTDVPLVGVAKGPDRDAGNETFYLPGRAAVQAAAARSAALFRPAAARRGAPLRRRLAPGAPQEGHPRGRPAGNSRHRPDPQARAAASFRDAEGDRARLARRSRQGAGHQRRTPRARSTISSTKARRRGSSALAVQPRRCVSARAARRLCTGDRISRRHVRAPVHASTWRRIIVSR